MFFRLMFLIQLIGLAPSFCESQLILYTIQLSKVTVLGAAGGIGQPLSLLLKLNPRVTDLALYDIRGGPGSSEFLEYILLRG